MGENNLTIIRNDADIQAGLAQLLQLDSRLAPIAALTGPLPLRLSQPGFAGLASIIVSQVVSRASADAIWSRITAVGPVTAQAYAALDPDVIATFGLSRAKAATLMALSQAVLDETVDLHGICALDGDDAIKGLTALPGIGPWTAQVYLMFCAGHPDVFPSGDVALQAAVGRAFAMDARPGAKMLAAMAKVWAPHRSVAARLFWAYYAVAMRRNGLPVA
jgi:DNA-3-methyladenine glycosylase II